MKINKNETGRSMVEMLGVLAVIGVLSIGGISGYKAAMNRIELNKMGKLFQHLQLAIETEQQKKHSLFDDDEFEDSSAARNREFCNLYAPEFCTSGLGTQLDGENSEHRFKLGTGNTEWSIAEDDPASALGSDSTCGQFTLHLVKFPTSICHEMFDYMEKTLGDYIFGWAYSLERTIHTYTKFEDAKQNLCSYEPTDGIKRIYALIDWPEECAE